MPPRRPEVGRPRELLVRRGPRNEAEAPRTRRRPSGARGETAPDAGGRQVTDEHHPSSVLIDHRRGSAAVNAHIRRRTYREHEERSDLDRPPRDWAPLLVGRTPGEFRLPRGARTARVGWQVDRRRHPAPDTEGARELPQGRRGRGVEPRACRLDHGVPEGPRGLPRDERSVRGVLQWRTATGSCNRSSRPAPRDESRDPGHRVRARRRKPSIFRAHSGLDGQEEEVEEGREEESLLRWPQGKEGQEVSEARSAGSLADRCTETSPRRPDGGGGRFERPSRAWSTGGG